MTKAISDLTNMDGTAAIDRSADFVEVSDSTGPTSYKATPNFILGITGDPVGTSDTQTLTAKTLTAPTISSPVLSGTITGTYTIGGTPTFPSAVVTLSGSQTLTNKTLTSPTINTATISNPTLTVDTVSEFTSANGVTVDGLNIKDGKLNTNNSVVTANVTDGAVTPAKRAGGFKVGTFTGNGTTSTQAITGVGFTPKLVRFTLRPGNSSTSQQFSQGVADGTTQFATAVNGNTSGNASSNSVTDGCIITIGTGGAITGKAAFTSFDADGFTITWSTASSNDISYEAYA